MSDNARVAALAVGSTASAETLDSIHSAHLYGFGTASSDFSPARCLFFGFPKSLLHEGFDRSSAKLKAMKRTKQSLPHCKIHKDSIDVTSLTARVSAVENGAVCTFLGQVRNLSRGRKVAYLEYDAYVPMAEKMLAKIAAEAADKWKAQIAIEHRIGRIELGEPSVAVCVGSPHRDAAFEACRYCI